MKKLYSSALSNLIMVIGLAGVIGLIKVENCFAAAENRKRKKEEKNVLVIVQQDQDLDSQLMQAVQESDEEKVVLLLEAKASANAYDKNTTALLCASHGKNMSILNALLDAHADIDKHDVLGETALMRATFYECIEAVRMLLVAGAAVDRQNFFNKDSALISICRSIHGGLPIKGMANCYEIMRLLLLAGANHLTCNKEAFSSSSIMDVGEGLAQMYKAIDEKEELEQALLDNRDGELKELLRTYVPVALASAIVDYDGDYLFLRERAKNR